MEVIVIILLICLPSFDMFDISGGGPTTNDLINNVSVNLSSSTMWHVGWHRYHLAGYCLQLHNLVQCQLRLVQWNKKYFHPFFICTVCYSLSVTNKTPHSLTVRWGHDASRVGSSSSGSKSGLSLGGRVRKRLHAI